MTHILFITSSASGDASDSNRVSARALDEIHRYRRDAVVRDLARDALPYIDEDFVTATHVADKARTAGQRAAPRRPNALIAELLAADLIVTAAAMMNSGVLSILKVWIHHICRTSPIFSYSEEGAKGFVSGKQVIVVVARGGIYLDVNKAADFQLSYLRNVLAFLGMTEVEVVQVEGTAFGPEAAGKSVAAAFRQLYERCSQAVAA
jgi:FMN-dependent NADH-azoreductase